MILILFLLLLLLLLFQFERNSLFYHDKEKVRYVISFFFFLITNLPLVGI